MNVRQLKKILESHDDNEIVYLSNPNYFGDDKQKRHENGVRYLVSSKNGEVWFETYEDENIYEECEAIIAEALETAMSDNDVIDILFHQDEHGYTLEDIRKNCEPSFYEWCLNSEYRKDMYPQ